MTRKAFYSLIGLSLFIYLTCFSQPLLAQSNGQLIIFISGTRIDEESQWLKETLNIKILCIDDSSEVNLQIIPDSGQVHITPTLSFPVKVHVDKKPYDSLIIQRQHKIKKYKISLMFDEDTNEECVYIDVKLGGKLDRKILEAKDLLIVPFVYKITGSFFRLLLPKKIKIQIFKKNAM